jgi:phosphatidylserine/phosphatidylglycerophosphate/cardiolipin synthase-like enzyme
VSSSGAARRFWILTGSFQLKIYNHHRRPHPQAHPSGHRVQQVMVIDGEMVITGSFNFTAAAQAKTPKTCW